MRRHLIPIFVAVPMAVVLLVVAGFVYEEVIAGDHVSRGVSAVGIDLGRMPVADAEAAIAAYERRLVDSPVTLRIGEREVSLLPEDVALAIDERAVVDRAMRERREPGFPAAIMAWMGTLFSEVEVEVPISVDQTAIEATLDRWTRDVIDHPAYEGAILVVDEVPVAEYPAAGTRVDTVVALPLIVASLSSPDRATVDLPLTDLVPQITDDDVDAALDRARQLVSGPVELRPTDGSTDGRLTLTPGELASALVSEVVVRSPAVLEVRFDEDRIKELVTEAVEAFTVPPVDAAFRFDEGIEQLVMVPSRVGRVVDVDQVTRVVTAAALGGGRGGLPMKDGALPSFTTEAALAMGELKQVSSFTTFHPCCESRVRNIQLIADAVDGAVVMPGEIFSVNEHVGERTEAKGYVRAGAIIGGRLECCDSPINVGGGTSQFATTLYNAVFFGCYEDITHTPHSAYFSRYPFIREATLGFPYPDVAFRNDSDAIVYLRTSHTSTSITVTLHGNNGGRTCESVTSGNTNTRIMTMPDGSEVRQSWTWTYRELLPPPTTTTVPPSTTSTAPTETTTTAPAATTTTAGGG